MSENGQLLYNIVHQTVCVLIFEKASCFILKFMTSSSFSFPKREGAVLFIFTKHFIFHFHFIFPFIYNTTSILPSIHFKFLNSSKLLPRGGDLGGFYSVLKLFTGLATAAFIVCNIINNTVISTKDATGSTNA